MRQILVPVDFSAVTAAIVDHAAQFAARFDAEIALLHVAAPDPDFVGYETGPETVREHVAADLREEHRELQILADSLRDRGLRAHAVSVQGSTVETILERAARKSCPCKVPPWKRFSNAPLGFVPTSSLSARTDTARSIARWSAASAKVSCGERPAPSSSSPRSPRDRMLTASRPYFFWIDSR